ncbi:uncharacterized protein LOC119273153 [Triticum dicoccoides]|uniref:uncharacterized protein LOC119273153 n=1 Tax=Triticum dicoccoides TaxID=85692 RepID=UPI00188DCF78|nr:uncharacterized protein LOC119273153 [Triticum dicoccoides]
MASKLPDTTKSLGAGAMDVEDGSGGGGKKVAGKWPGFVHFFFVLTVVMCALVYAPRFLSPAVSVDFLGLRQPALGRAAEGQGQGVHGGRVNEGEALVLDNQVGSPCASMGGHGICCDRSDYNTDVCFMAGDVRTDAASLSLLLYPPPNGTANANANATSGGLRGDRVQPAAYVAFVRVVGAPGLRIVGVGEWSAASCVRARSREVRESEGEGRSKGTRVIENEAAVARLAVSVGFDVSILETANGAPLSSEYAAVSACDVLAGVHGADLTKLLFLRPGRAALLQVAPLGVPAVARGCYEKATTMMGMQYEQYDAAANESSLVRKYAADDVVLRDPEAAKQGGGWDLIARVYLSGQNVSLDLDRFGDTLRRLHARALRLPVAGP